MSLPTILVIGQNSKGEFGLNHALIKELTNVTEFYKDIKINSVHCGCKHVIYAEENMQNSWAAGYNRHSQCAIPYDENKSDGNVTSLSAIKYFKNNNINIKKICCNSVGDNSFWITDKKQVYGIGCNSHKQMGLTFPGKNVSTPKLITALEDVVDIKATDNQCIALCATNIDIAIGIVKYWSSLNSLLPNDLVQIIVMFYHTINVYSTNNFGNGEKKTMYSSIRGEWNKIESFIGLNIIKISSGYHHSMYVEKNGRVWSCGVGTGGELGLGEIQRVYKPKIIESLNKNNIKIKDITCGGYHTLAIDINNKIWSWGYNKMGQCGSDAKRIHIPTIIDALKQYNANIIQCGFWHSYCGTMEGMHFMFGSNNVRQCITANGDDREDIQSPNCINPVIEIQYKHMIIKTVMLGFDSTIVVLSEK